MADESVQDFLDDLALDNPEPEEPWRAEGDFDPPFKRATLRAAWRWDLIELDRIENDARRFRFTAKGRAELRRGRERREA